MKDSGVEWLGKIPTHWEVLSLKRLGIFQAGAGFPDDEQGMVDEDLPFFKVGDLARSKDGKHLDIGPNSISKDTAKRLRAYVFPAGTIVFAKVGAALKLNRRRILTRPACIDNNMMGFITDRCDRDWAFCLLCSLDLGELANPGAVPSVNEGQAREIQAALPPIDEQRAIGSFLDRETAKIDALMSKIREAITSLREYRTALISAAVTGKIDVREA
jgi:type I restriction enzyme S subunit